MIKKDYIVRKHHKRPLQVMRENFWPWLYVIYNIANYVNHELIAAQLTIVYSFKASKAQFLLFFELCTLTALIALDFQFFCIYISVTLFYIYFFNYFLFSESFFFLVHLLLICSTETPTYFQSFNTDRHND